MANEKRRQAAEVLTPGGLFCPRCGEPNDEKTKYCRVCGENLKILARAMSGHFPVVLAGKLDEIVESKSERFRRNGILGVFMGAIFLVLSGWGFLSDYENTFVFLIGAVFGILPGIWDLLAYRRIRDLEKTPAPPAGFLKEFYCPACGEQNQPEDKFCRKCGLDLKMVERVLIRRPPKTFLERQLDGYIEYRNSQLSKGWLLSGLVLGLLFLVFGIYLFVNDDAVFGIFLFLSSLLMLATVGWDWLTYRRNLPPDSQETSSKEVFVESFSNNQELSSDPETKKLPPPAEPPETASLNISEVTTRHLEMNPVKQKKENESRNKG